MRWVSPFGHRRIKACCQLPDAFRRLPRPSSPLTAKASTVYALSLDHITPSRLKVTRPIDVSPFALTTHLGSTDPKRLSLDSLCQRTQNRPQRLSVSNAFVCAVSRSTGFEASSKRRFSSSPARDGRFAFRGWTRVKQTPPYSALA